MKLITLKLIPLLFFFIITFTSGQTFNTTQQNLPEGAITRLGHGTIISNVVLSPDDSTIAVPSSVGIWLYDTRTYQLRTLLTGHSGKVTTVEFSSTGDMLASGGEDTTVKMWHTDSGKQITTLDGHIGAITRILFSPKEQILATGSKDDTIRIWNLKTKETIAILRGHTQGVESMAFSSDGNLLASGALGESYVWDIRTGKRVYTLPQGIEGKTSIALSPDGNALVTINNPIKYQYNNAIRIWDFKNPEGSTLFESKSGSSDITGMAISSDGETLSAIIGGKIHLWELSTRIKLFTDSPGNHEIKKIHFSPDANLLLSSDKYNRIYMWDISQGWLDTTDITTIQSKSNIDDLLFYHDGSCFLSRNQEGIQFWCVEKAERTATIPLFEAKGNLDYSPDGKNIVNWVGNYKQIYLLNITNENKVMKKFDLDIPSNYINSVKFSPDGSSLLVWGSGNYLTLWNPNTGKIKVKLQEYKGEISTFTFSPDSQTLTVGSGSGEIVLYDIESGVILKTITTGTEKVSLVTYSIHGKLIASWSKSKKIQLWNSNTGELFPTLNLDMNANIQPVLKFLPDERTLAYSPDINTIQFWDIESRQSLHRISIDKPFSSTFSPDGKVMAHVNFNSKGFISLWDISKGIKIGTLNPESSIWFPLLFTPDGRKLIHRIEENNILVWDIDSMELINSFSGHDGRVNDIALSPDGNTVASTGDENTILLWDISK
ncbi:hypothetical protein C6497_16295 [Candidatus Poribacteria bacterium]|nr:MAG: hypothetical protein C6497_16295 [Candidatus Poribacteria bacterium]